MKRTLPGARLLLQGFAFLCASLLSLVAHSQAPLFTFAQISDSQATPGDPTEQAMFEAVLDTIIAGGQAGALLPHPVSFILFPGDLVDKPLDTGEWTIFNDTIATRLTANGIPYRAVPGNHDWHPSIGFSHYETYIASAAVWQTGSDLVSGHNGPAVATGWRGLHFIGFNNSNGAYNTISAADLSLIDQLAGEASARSENIFLLGHHYHDEGDVIPLAQTLGNPDVVGYMRGHTGSPHASSGLSGVSNPNVWDLNSHDINNRGTILYIEVYATQLQVYVIQLVDAPTSLPAPVTIPLVHPMVSAGPPVAPTADFSASPLSGEAPLAVAFTDLSDGAPTAWDWDFGDGGTSTQQSPEHVYAEGTYDVSLTVTNAQGNDALVEYSLISVDPAPPMVTYAAIADAHVRSSQPTTNYGTLDYVRVRDDATAYHGYFMFDVNGLGGASIVSATLRLYVEDGSDEGGSLQLANNGWTELGITWDTVPGSTYIGDLGPAPLDTWLEFDVTAQVAGEGTYSFAVLPNSTNSVFYTSREGVNPPELVLVLDDPAPDISVSPLSHDYGLVAVGASANTVVNVANSGSATLMVSGTVLAGDDAAEFDLSGGGAFSLDPGVNQDIQVAFEPVSGGQKNATLQVSSDDPDEPVIDVVLFGLSTVLSPDIAVLPPGIDFGSVDVGQSDAHSVSITNAGSADLNVTGLSLSGPNPGDFGLGGPASFSLSPGASQEVPVDFTPASEGAKSASLEIASDDPDEPSVPVSLQGVGVVPGC